MEPALNKERLLQKGLQREGAALCQDPGQHRREPAEHTAQGESQNGLCGNGP